MRLSSTFLGFISLLVPPCTAKSALLRLLGWKIGRNCKIGFSWIPTKNVNLSDDARIGHGNFIRCQAVLLRTGAYIGHINRITGPMYIVLKENAGIGNQNTIIRGVKGVSWGRAIFSLGTWSKLTVSHIVDCTRSVKVGSYSILAGRGSQLWTHGYLHASSGLDRTRIDGAIAIGDNVYIGSSCILNAGVSIGNSITVGTGSCVSRSLTMPGLYVSQPLRHVEYNYEESAHRYPEVKAQGLVERVINKKNRT